MKYQQVSVDLVNMMMTACSYLALAGAAWVFLRLLQACFWLPRHLRKQNNVQKFLQDKIDRYEKYLADCEAKEELQGDNKGESDGVVRVSENSEKWRKQRESLELLKKELNKVKDGVNISDWDYLLEENNQDRIAVDSDDIDGSEDATEKDFLLPKEEAFPKKLESANDDKNITNNEDKKNDVDNTCEKKKDN